MAPPSLISVGAPNDIKQNLRVKCDFLVFDTSLFVVSRNCSRLSARRSVEGIQNWVAWFF